MKIQINIHISPSEAAELGETLPEIAEKLQELLQFNLPELLRFNRQINKIHHQRDAPEKARANAQTDAPPENTLF
jgi:predicted RNase H-like HicB family nuclease